MSETQALPLGDVLSVVTGRLVSRDHIGGVYRVCDFMTGEANFTHQLPRVSETIAPAIVAQHPWLAEIEVPQWSEPTKETVYAWLDSVEAEHGATVSLVPLAEYDAPNPIEELCDMVGPERVFVARADGEGGIL